jgi:hypothetical protein
MLFWLSSTVTPALVVNVGVCSLAIFVNWLELIFGDSIGVPGVGLKSRQPGLMRCQAAPYNPHRLVSLGPSLYCERLLTARVVSPRHWLFSRRSENQKTYTPSRTMIPRCPRAPCGYTAPRQARRLCYLARTEPKGSVGILPAPRCARTHSCRI